VCVHINMGVLTIMKWWWWQ